MKWYEIVTPLMIISAILISIFVAVFITTEDYLDRIEIKKKICGDKFPYTNSTIEQYHKCIQYPEYYGIN